jgi:hypothetical protein
VPEAQGIGVWGTSDTGPGVFGASSASNGVHGASSNPRTSGVWGHNTAGGVGVAGSCEGGNGYAGQFTGDVQTTGTHWVGGDVILTNISGLDCAEDFQVADNETVPDPGTVVVMADDGNVKACESEFATNVIGVVSGAGGLKAGITLGRRPAPSRPCVPVALLGRVYCKAEASDAPIRIGDLLTTSLTPGHAMRVTDPSRAFGCVIGKALDGLRDGTGLIPVLVSLR